ncbi:protein Cripto [Crocuta crocuta]
MDRRKMDRFSCSVILIVAISKAFELKFVAAGLGHPHELARPSQGDPALRDDGIRSQEEPAVRHRSLQLVSSFGIQDSKELNKTCCLNGGTCMLGSFCACPPSFYGRNCEHDSRKENCESVPHGTWLPKRCSMCKCWRGRLHCFPQTFLPGCDGHVMDEYLLVSRTPELTLSSSVTFSIAGICLAIQSYC